MNKKTRSLIVGAGVLAALIAAYFIITGVAAAKEKAEEASKEGIFKAGADEVGSLRYTDSAGEEVAIVRDGDGWAFEGDDEAKANAEACEALVEDLAGCTVEQYVEAGELSDYGLDEPANTIEYTLASGEGGTLLVGTSNTATGGLYCMREGEEKIMVTQYAVITALSTSKDTLTEAEEPSEASSDAASESSSDEADSAESAQGTAS